MGIATLKERRTENDRSRQALREHKVVVKVGLQHGLLCKNRLGYI